MNDKEQTIARARAALEAVPMPTAAAQLLARYQATAHQKAPSAPINTRPKEAFPPLAQAPHQPPQGSADKPKRQPAAVVLAHGTDLNPEPIRWLWPNWLALGKLHILAGAPGQGKTTIAMALAATVTQGGRWPDGMPSRVAGGAGNVLIWSGEDDPADTLLPRLLAAGADRGRCYFIQGTRAEDGSVNPFDPGQDLPGLQQAIERIGGVRLLVIDPVVSAVTGDSHKNTEVRRSLQPLVDLAAAVGCAVLGITHFAKGGQGQDPAQRVVGSVAFTAVARVVMVAAKVQAEAGEDGEQEDRRILARSKSNIGPDDGGIEYHLEQSEVLEDIQSSRIAWGRQVQGSARELLTDPDAEPDETQDAISFLRTLLSDKPTSSKALFKAAKEVGFSEKQTRTALKKLGATSAPSGFGKDWEWVLPTSSGRIESARVSPHLPEFPTFQNRENLESLGKLCNNPYEGKYVSGSEIDPADIPL